MTSSNRPAGWFFLLLVSGELHPAWKVMSTQGSQQKTLRWTLRIMARAGKRKYRKYLNRPFWDDGSLIDTSHASWHTAPLVAMMTKLRRLFLRGRAEGRQFIGTGGRTTFPPPSHALKNAFIPWKHSLAPKFPVNPKSHDHHIGMRYPRLQVPIIFAKGSEQAGLSSNTLLVLMPEEEEPNPLLHELRCVHPQIGYPHTPQHFG